MRKGPVQKPAAFRTMPDGREICSSTSAGKAEYRTRTIEMQNRQNNRCALCGFSFHSNDVVTFDHEHGRGMGGGKRDDRILIEIHMEVDGFDITAIKRQNAAVHYRCNAEKGSRKVEYCAQ